MRNRNGKEEGRKYKRGDMNGGEESDKQRKRKCTKLRSAKYGGQYVDKPNCSQSGHTSQFADSKGGRRCFYCLHFQLSLAVVLFSLENRQFVQSIIRTRLRDDSRNNGDDSRAEVAHSCMQAVMLYNIFLSN